jgi:hypothetical protein
MRAKSVADMRLQKLFHFTRKAFRFCHWHSCSRYSITSSVSRNDSEMAGYLAGGFKLDIGNPVALAPAQASLFILALEG